MNAELIAKGLDYVKQRAEACRDIARRARERSAFAARNMVAQDRQVAVDYDAEAVALEGLLAHMETSFEAVRTEHLEWCAVTFPCETIESIYKHLQEEIAELGDAKSDPLELADCLLLLLSFAARMNMDPVAAMRAKLAINKGRKWFGMHHVKEEGEPGPAPAPDGLKTHPTFPPAAPSIQFLSHELPEGGPYEPQE